MTVMIKALADGQLSDSKATLYTTPASTNTIIKSITLVNTDGSARTLNIYVNRTGTSRRIAPKDLSLAAGAYTAYSDIITLETGDKIEGDASVAAVVDYTINGVEES
uniref:Uncharacterized protein n=1 Tax=viral metagenome TaxID=1070528 RepID=A0A6M3L889_9ZZZZ